MAKEYDLYIYETSSVKTVHIWGCLIMYLLQECDYLLHYNFKGIVVQRQFHLPSLFLSFIQQINILVLAKLCVVGWEKWI